ncbi:MAG: AsmA family protein [Acidobacteriia bacterium]|nr:AsmA family protein [Terriglobia bacterium]
MMRKRWLRRAGLAVLALVAGHFAFNAALQTGRLKRAFTARFATAFGRPVEVERFELSLLPSPRLEAQGVSVGEDPAFGYEYFLRAEQVTAGLRWSGLLRGRLEFGTFSFTRPSLNLVRDAAGRWNLERWLPPARAAGAPRMGPVAPPAAPIRLDLVEFDDGRINFKNAEEKLPLAFTGVSGSVEQIAPGRWTLRLKAQPWRSGTLLQAAGTLLVRGDLAGTSARLQPAEIRVHWGQVSLADLLRLVRGQDYGLRGDVTVDAVARSGAASGAPSGEWSFRIEARSQRIHRWDLTERRDNPAVNVLLDGRWNIAGSEVRVAPLVIEGPHSNVRGEAVLSLSARPGMQLRLDSAGIQMADVLAWVRGFHANVAEQTAAEGFLTGTATLEGWPFALRNAAFAMNGAALRVPGLAQSVRVGPVRGGQVRSRLELQPVWVALGAVPAALPAPGAKQAPAKRRGPTRPVEAPANAVLAAAAHDLESGAGWFTLEGRVERAEEVLALAAALGRPLERGWKGKGSAAGALRWTWQGTPRNAQLSGHVDVSQGELQAAGLNLPLLLHQAQLLWSAGKRGARLGSVEGFGAEWSGEIEEDGRQVSEGAPGWKFQLHADHLNAAELDRWTGPRARPGWLQRLLPSLLGNAPPGAAAGATELIRRIRAEGEIRVDQLSIERLRLTKVQAAASLRELHLVVREATAEYAGGAVRGSLQADFAPRPRYVLEAQLEKVRLADLLAPAKGPRAPADRLEGLATGELRLAAEGVGREELLRTLEGRGRVQLRNVALRGWDIAASLAAGAPRAGTSRWSAGAGEFAIRQSAIVFDPLRLGSGGEQVVVSGKVSFARSAELTLQTAAGKRAAEGAGTLRLLRLSGSLDAPQVAVETQIR